MAVKPRDAKIPAWRSSYPEALEANPAGFLYRLPWDRGLRYRLLPLDLESQSAAL